MQKCSVAFGNSGTRDLVAQMTNEVCAAYVSAFLTGVARSFSFGLVIQRYRRRILWLWVCACCMTGFAMVISLPATAATFEGSYEIEDVNTSPNCAYPNGLTGYCSCPGDIAPDYSFTVINPEQVTGDKKSRLNLCLSRTALGIDEFSSGFQLDDSVPTGQSCRVKNALSGDCSCPPGTQAAHMRVLAGVSGGVVGSNIYLCMKPAAAPGSFGGVYQLDDPVPSGIGCRSPNPFTGGCGCAKGFRAQAHRVEVDTAKGFIGTSIFTCIPKLDLQHLCPGSLEEPDADLVDPTGRLPVNSALQQCIDAQPKGGVLEIPVGRYRMEGQVHVTKPIILRTQGAKDGGKDCNVSNSCAVLVAGENFLAPGGMIILQETSAVSLDHIVLDGNRSARIGSKAYTNCKAANSIVGWNARAINCTNCSFTNSASINALCGTGFEWRGDGAIISNSLFQGNGDHFDSNVWADGLTLLQSNYAVVIHNRFIDNSDIGFIVGGAVKAQIKNNQIFQNGTSAFAGFMLDNFNGGTSGDFTDAVISGNKIECGKDKCLYGMNLGPHAWYSSTNIMGGSITSNVISGGIIALNADGSGTSQKPIDIFNNTLTPETNPVLSATAACKGMKAAAFSASSDSTLSARSMKPDVLQSVHGCVGQTSW